VLMKTRLNLDGEPARERDRAVAHIGEDTGTVLWLAIRVGLPIIAGFEGQRPRVILLKLITSCVANKSNKTRLSGLDQAMSTA
jgi:hypothetical protein